MAIALQTQKFVCEWLGDTSRESLNVLFDFNKGQTSKGLNERYLRVSHVDKEVYHILMKADDRFLNEVAKTGNPDIALVCCAGRSFFLNASKAKISPINTIPITSVVKFGNFGLCIVGFHEILFADENLKTATVSVEPPDDISSIDIYGLKVKILIEGREGQELRMLDVDKLNFQTDIALLHNLGLGVQEQ
jgi:hypothetical protein